MRDRRAADVARRFLAVVWGDERPTIEALSAAIDRLLAESHGIADCHPAEDDSEPLEVDFPALYREVAHRFPDLGFYPVADPLASIGEAPTLADAIDDLADITKDLREVVWRDEHLGADDAAWFFRLNFFHWGRHARELSLYLHARRWE